MDTIQMLKKKIKVCDTISITALIFIVVCFLAEYLLAQYFGDSNVVMQIVQVLVYIGYVLPFAVMIPLFFRVNLKNKLVVEKRRQQNDISKQ